jgi:hypothetical protein
MVLFIFLGFIDELNLVLASSVPSIIFGGMLQAVYFKKKKRSKIIGEKDKPIQRQFTP